MSKHAVSRLVSGGVLVAAILSLGRQSRAGDCRPVIEEVIITDEPYAAISGAEVEQVGDTLAIRLKYQLHNPDGNEQARGQIFLAVEQSIVATIYDGSPGLCPGATGSWSSPSIAVIALPPGSHPVYAVHTTADSQAAGLDGYEHEGIGRRVEIGVFVIPEMTKDEVSPDGHTVEPPAEEACPPETGGDTDGDRVCGNQDACPGSDVRLTIVIQECDCLVTNQVVGAGCTMADEIAALMAEARKAKDFARSVSRLATSWERAGLVGEADKKRIESCSEQAFFPAKEPTKIEPPASEPDKPPKPPAPPAETQVDEPTPGYHNDAEETGEFGEDPASEAAGPADRITGFESAANKEPSPVAGCGFGLILPSLLGLGLMALRHPDRR